MLRQGIPAVKAITVAAIRHWAEAFRRRRRQSKWNGRVCIRCIDQDQAGLGCYIIWQAWDKSKGKVALSMTVLHGEDLRQAFSAATRCLERFRDTINALNVFPVPDGDTGTNMLLTMRSALEKFTPEPCSAAGEALDTLAEGAFWGARGNSGVILSQFFKGFADVLHGKEVCGGADLAQGFSRASDAAVSACGSTFATTVPCRRIVASWQSCFTSSSRCEM